MGPHQDKLRIVLITGISGAGKTTALRALEDLGFYCVDNLPLPLLDDFIATMKREPTVEKVALVVDARLRSYTEGYALAAMDHRAKGNLWELLYVDARDDLLVRRFSQTRRRHPLNAADLLAGLDEERELLAPLRAQAGTCIDSTDLTVHQLKQVVQDRYRSDETTLVLTVISFGFRYGLPAQADLVFDVRFLPNPYFIEDLRALSGKQAPVADYVFASEEAQGFLQHAEKMLDFLVPLYHREGKVYLTVAIGCTGGRHRSVALTEKMGNRLAALHNVQIRHRDLERSSKSR
jgi:RNase adapter protein RapZ